MNHPTTSSTVSLEQRRKELTDKIAEVAAAGPSKGGAKRAQNGNGVSFSSFVSLLFGRASADFIESHDVASLSDIAQFTWDCGERFMAANQPRGVEIVSRSTNGHSAFAIALGDRPFIVNTVTELLRHNGVRLHTYVHPLVRVGGQQFSLSYLETEALDDQARAGIEQKIRSALQDLILATDDFAAMVARNDALASELTKRQSPESQEMGQFLRWLADGNFVFLGHSEWPVSGTKQVGEADGRLGVFQSQGSYVKDLVTEARDDVRQILEQGKPVLIGKLRTESPVHRLRNLTHLAVPLIDGGKPSSVHSLIGLLTSKALSQECSTIPLIRLKLQQLIEHALVPENSHDYKNIVDIIDRMPKEEALRLDVNELRELVEAALEVQDERAITTLIRPAAEGRGVSILLVLPRERFSTQLRYTLQAEIEHFFDVPRGSAQFHLDVSNKPQVRLYYYVPFPGAAAPVDHDNEQLANALIALCRTWDENLEEQLNRSAILTKPQTLLRKYRHAFSGEYQALHSIEDAELDIRAIESMTKDHPLKVTLSFHSAEADQQGGARLVAPSEFELSVYSLEEITVSKAVPMLENAGFEVISEQTYTLSPAETPTVYIQRFTVRSSSNIGVTPANFEQYLAPALTMILEGTAGNDQLNALVMTASLDVKAVELLRTYCYLLWQATQFASRRTMFTALSAEPDLSRRLWQMFETKFDPALKLSVEERRTRFAAMLEEFKAELRRVSDITRDKIFRSLSSLLEHTMRTNFYEPRSAAEKTIALKLQSEKIEIMPQPRPKFEIYVNSPVVEGVHLRADMVARGGLRWSDRYDDFRSEVLGLVKTQKIKNVVIVPTGAKGGFVVRNLPATPAQQKPAVENAYRTFIRALLSVTDNRVNDKIVPPANVIRFDGDDPYLVVAADKGTATFSDIANGIAVQEFDFWLGDAFASGGSNGYDHKVYGITAKGAWECVKRHFNDIGIDYTKNPFTVIGIGDMSGDVFGNGLIMSDKMKLIAAFNHKHIFLDPNPDPAASFKERMRLFTTPGTQWSDYDAKLISKGGAVFPRASKEITITPEARQALGLADDVPPVLNGEQLVSHILRAPADLLWNGGIGTYVKASTESQTDAHDSTNDEVRIDAPQLRARVIGEGGNLGFTQKGRIEFAQRGGRLNTDAVDNSGGVDLSDHEVNLKILFSGLMRDKKIDVEARNKLMKEVAEEVCELVLDHNREHALILTLATERSQDKPDHFQGLIRQLVRLGYVNRALEGLPEDEVIDERLRTGLGLTRPELAVVMAANKMWVKSSFLESTLSTEKLLQPFLLSYFPAEVVKRFEGAVLAHPLGKNIIATQITNTFLDEVGITFMHRMGVVHSASPEAILRSWLAAHLLLDSARLKKAMAALDKPETASTFLAYRRDLGIAIRATSAWLVSQSRSFSSLEEMVAAYQPSYRAIVQQGEDLLGAEEVQEFRQRVQEAEGYKLDNYTSRSLAIFPRMMSVLEVLRTTRSTKAEVKMVGQVFRAVRDELKLAPLLASESQITPRSKWESELLVTSSEEIRSSVSAIATSFVKRGVSDANEISRLLRQNNAFEQLRGSVEELRGKSADAAALTVIARKMRLFEA